MSIVSTSEILEKDIIKRKPVYVISHDDVRKSMADYETGKFLIEPKVSYLIAPTETDIEETKFDIIKQMYSEGSLEPNKVLLYDEKQKRYFSYYELVSDTLKSQMLNFINFCQDLGAKEVNLYLSETDTKNSNKTLKAEAGKKGVATVGGQKHNSILEEVVSTMETTTTFEGAEPNIARAKRMVDNQVFGKNNELGIKQLYNMTCSGHGNKLKTHKVTMTFAENLSKTLEVFAELDAPILRGAMGKVSFEKLQSSAKKCTVSYEIIF